MDKFKAKQAIQDITNWIRHYFAESGPKSKAVIGISGGKDSTVAATLLVEALGPERVVGILMPNYSQSDMGDSLEVCDMLGIQYYIVDIGESMEYLTHAIPQELFGCDNEIYYTNTPARLRMTTLYGIAGLIGGRVANTCNMSEDYVGYSTKWGDNAGDFAILANYTVSEVIAIGEALNLPPHLIYKTPADGMSGKSDEEKLGVSYQEIDEYIMYGVVPPADALAKMRMLYDRSRHKVKHMPTAPNPFWHKHKNNRMQTAAHLEEGEFWF